MEKIACVLFLVLSAVLATPLPEAVASLPVISQLSFPKVRFENTQRSLKKFPASSSFIVFPSDEISSSVLDPAGSSRGAFFRETSQLKNRRTNPGEEQKAWLPLSATDKNELQRQYNENFLLFPEVSERTVGVGTLVKSETRIIFSSASQEGITGEGISNFNLSKGVLVKCKENETMSVDGICRQVVDFV